MFRHSPDARAYRLFWQCYVVSGRDLWAWIEAVCTTRGCIPIEEQFQAEPLARWRSLEHPVRLLAESTLSLVANKV